MYENNMNKRPFNDIKGKVCIITGGGGVLGTDFAFGLADAGAKVALLDFKEENADAVAKKVNDLYTGSTISVFANVLEKETLLTARHGSRPRPRPGDRARGVALEGLLRPVHVPLAQQGEMPGACARSHSRA